MSVQSGIEPEIGNPAAVGEPEGQLPDTRQHPRVFNPPLHVSGIWGTVYDVSEGGICLVTTTPLQAGDQYELILTDCLVHFTKEIRAEVVWYRRGRAGLRWIDLAPDQLLWLDGAFACWDEEGPAMVVRMVS